MHFASRDLNESVLYGLQVKERRNRNNLDFPNALAKRFEFLVFSTFVLEEKNKSIEICYTTDDNRQTWSAEHLIEKEIDVFSQVKPNSCTPITHDIGTLHCTATSKDNVTQETLTETDRAAVLMVGLGMGLRLYLAAHIPVGFADSLFQGIVAYADDIFGGFEAYAEDLVYGRNRAELTSAEYWIKHIKSPALVFFGNGTVLAKNPAMEKSLRKGGELRLVDGRIQPPRSLGPLFARRTENASRDIPAHAGKVQPSKARIINSAGGHRYFVETIPSPTSEDETGDPVRTYFRKKVLITTGSASNDASAEAIKAATGVTHQQARIIQKIIGGKTVRQAAEEIGISYNTARNHLAMAQQRTGTSSQLELVNSVTKAIQIAPDQ
ncbi:helix-turn-helix transcriptional regulator [Roseibium aggregatum]|uniref:helix-turn-helix transcriptional regulator n=1 Tax=Roseibium aggregatum TaxID=187304 RepID=UPI003A982DB7